MLKAVEAVGEHLAGIQPPGGQQGGQFLHAAAAAGHQAAGDDLVAHAAAPLHPGNAHIVAGAQVVDVADAPAGLEHGDGLHEGVLRVAAGHHHPVHALAVGEGHDLLHNVALSVVDDVGGAVLPGQGGAVGAGAHGVQVGGAPQGRARHRHQAHRADADDAHVVAELHVGQLHAVKAGGHHVAEHHRRGHVDVGGQQGQVGVGLVDVEQLAEHAVLEVGELPPRQHAAGVHGVACLGLQRAPVGGDGGDDDPVAGLEVLHQRAHLHHLAHGLVAEDHVVAVADGALPDRVHVRGAGGHGQRLHQRVQRAAGGGVLLNPAGLSDPEHCKSFHGSVTSFLHF